mmetsp:Transcript_20623/g.44954  ORF Transcript_20623/g.44954 Transcript_20623/m.44954 type:complete len:266 (+) Transcript_20623:333-1130(+)
MGAEQSTQQSGVEADPRPDGVCLEEDFGEVKAGGCCSSEGHVESLRQEAYVENLRGVLVELGDEAIGGNAEAYYAGQSGNERFHERIGYCVAMPDEIDSDHSVMAVELLVGVARLLSAEALYGLPILNVAGALCEKYSEAATEQACRGVLEVVRVLFSKAEGIAHLSQDTIKSIGLEEQAKPDQVDALYAYEMVAFGADLFICPPVMAILSQNLHLLSEFLPVFHKHDDIFSDRWPNTSFKLYPKLFPLLRCLLSIMVSCVVQSP